jgi:hypothetical protein
MHKININMKRFSMSCSEIDKIKTTEISFRDILAKSKPEQHIYLQSYTK